MHEWFFHGMFYRDRWEEPAARSQNQVEARFEQIPLRLFIIIIGTATIQGIQRDL